MDCATSYDLEIRLKPDGAADLEGSGLASFGGGGGSALMSIRRSHSGRERMPVHMCWYTYILRKYSVDTTRAYSIFSSNITYSDG